MGEANAELMAELNASIERVKLLEKGLEVEGLRAEAANLIKTLSASLDGMRKCSDEFVRRNDFLSKELDTVREERDGLEAELEAAKQDIYELCADPDCQRSCYYCKHRESDGQCLHECKPYYAWGWEWREPCAKNGG